MIFSFSPNTTLHSTYTIYILHGNQDITATAPDQSASLCRLLELSLPIRCQKNGSPSLIHHIKKSSFTNTESAVITQRTLGNTEEHNYLRLFVPQGYGTLFCVVASFSGTYNLTENFFYRTFKYISILWTIYMINITTLKIKISCNYVQLNWTI